MSHTAAIPGPTKPSDDEVSRPKAPDAIPSPGRARAFTTWIDKRSHEDAGVRAALRRGVGKDLDAVPFMHRFVASWLTDEQTRNRDVQRAYYTVASLIAAQRRDQYAAAKDEAPRRGTPAGGPEEEASGPQGGPDAAAFRRISAYSLGHAFADGVIKGGQGSGLRETSAETRLNLLTRQSVDGLHRHLPGAVRQLRDRDVEIDWARLLVDLCQWRRRSAAIKRVWLQDYHRTLQKDGERKAREQDDQQTDAAENTDA